MDDELVPVPENKINGKTTSPPPESWDDHRFKYTQETIERILNLKVGGKTYKELSDEFHIPLTTLYFWGQKQKQDGTELGKKLCTLRHTPKPKAVRPVRVEFPGGSVYREASDGSAVLEQTAAQAPEKASAPNSQGLEDSFVDAVFEELAVRLGRKEIEIISLKLQLKCLKR